GEPDVAATAEALRQVLSALAVTLDGPPYNLVLHTAPLREQVDATYHWHWEVHPRLREIAGLELGTGLPVNPVSPEDAVEELFAPHHGEIYAYLIRMLRDPELAADLTQDAFVKAYRNYDTLEKPENARAWLYQIAHRVALDHIRRQKIVRFLPWTGESRGAVPSAERLVMDAHLSADMQRALARIPERQRAALLLA